MRKVDFSNISCILVLETNKEFKIKRVTLDMTQEQLADALGLNPNTISRYETGALQIPKAIELAIETLLARQSENPA